MSYTLPSISPLIAVDVKQLSHSRLGHTRSPSVLYYPPVTGERWSKAIGVKHTTRHHASVVSIPVPDDPHLYLVHILSLQLPRTTPPSGNLQYSSCGIAPSVFCKSRQGKGSSVRSSSFSLSVLFSIARHCRVSSTIIFCSRLFDWTLMQVEMPSASSTSLAWLCHPGMPSCPPA